MSFNKGSFSNTSITDQQKRDVSSQTAPLASAVSPNERSPPPSPEKMKMSNWKEIFVSGKTLVENFYLTEAVIC